MREIFWRATAVALAAVIAWLAWPKPKTPAIAEFSLEPPCGTVFVEINNGQQIACWENNERVVYDNPLKAKGE